MGIRLGKMQRIVDLQSVWQHEEHDFSQWLAKDENLAQLAEAVGIDMELEETESSVGSFSVDIYAKEVGTSRGIIIENQLERYKSRSFRQNNNLCCRQGSSGDYLGGKTCT